MIYCFIHYYQYSNDKIIKFSNCIIKKDDLFNKINIIIQLS